MTIDRAILWKEFRSLWWVAALGAVILFGMQSSWFAGKALSPETIGFTAPDSFDLVALSYQLSWDALGETYLRYAVGLLGVALGLLQSVRESRRDRWALLIHRPITRERLFFNLWLVGAGLGLAGLALACGPLVVWMAWPGSLPRPFEIQSLLPLLLLPPLALAGHAAGLIAGWHHGAWWGLRVVPIATVVLLASLGGLGSPVPTLLLSLLTGLWALTLVLVARAVFQRGGETREVHPRRSLALAVVLGLSLTVLLLPVWSAGSLIWSVISGPAIPDEEVHHRWYDLSRTGIPQIIGYDVSPLGTTNSRSTLDGQETEDGELSPDWHRAFTVINPHPRSAEVTKLTWQRVFQGSASRWELLRARDLYDRIPGSRVYWRDLQAQAVMVMDQETCRPVGFLGPDGIQATASVMSPIDRTRLIWRHGDSDLYLLDADRGALRFERLEAAHSGDTDVTLIKINTSGGYHRPARNWDLLLARNGGAMVLRDRSGIELERFAIPFDLEQEGRYLRFHLLRRTDGSRAISLMVQGQEGVPVKGRGDFDYQTLGAVLTERGADGPMTSTTLSALPPSRFINHDSWQGSILLPLWMVGAMELLPNIWRISPLRWLGLGIGTTLSILLCGWLAARRRLPWSLRIAWLLTGLITGLVAPVVLRALHPRVTDVCPSCGRRRLIERDRCEHCEAEWGAPPTDGREMIVSPAA